MISRVFFSSDEDIIESNAGGAGYNVQPPAPSEYNSRSVPTHPRFIAPAPPPTTSASSYNSRITVKRRPGRAGSAGLGPSHLGSLSNLTSVAEQPPTPCAVSHHPQQQQQPLWPPKVLLSTPCNIGIIREAEREQKFREISRNSGEREEINTSMTSNSTTNRKRETLWMRRHSLHAQPQPLSVHGFGYGSGQGHQADRHSGLSGHQADRLSELRQQQQQPTANTRSFRRLSMTSLHLAHSASEKFLKRRSFDGSGYHAGQPTQQPPPSVMVTNPGMPVNSASRRMSCSGIGEDISRSAHRRLASPSYVQMDSNQVYVRPSSMTSMHAKPGNTNHLRVGRVIY